jgi:hypothetical protein
MLAEVVKKAESKEREAVTNRKLEELKEALKQVSNASKTSKLNADSVERRTEEGKKEF